MRGIARHLRNLWLDWRTLRWLVRLRLELRRHGARLRVEGWRGVRMLEQPRIRTNPLGKGSGVTTIRLSPEVMIGYGVIVEIYAHGDNLLELDRASRIYEGARIELRGGSIHVGERCMVHDHAVLQSDGELVLGEDVRVSYGSCLHCSERIELGAHSTLAANVTIADCSHTADGTDAPTMTTPLVKDPVLIEQNVWITSGAVVLMGTRIGRNSVVAANSLVRGGEYPRGFLIAGAPAKAIKELDPLPDRRFSPTKSTIRSPSR
jgi:acetyltransferase-like isoleucine patch superfamily enzyme